MTDLYGPGPIGSPSSCRGSSCRPTGHPERAGRRLGVLGLGIGRLQRDHRRPSSSRVYLTSTKGFGGTDVRADLAIGLGARHHRRRARRAPRAGHRPASDGTGRRKFWLARQHRRSSCSASPALVLRRARAGIPALARPRPARRRHAVLRDRHRQLQRDAVAGLDPEDRRPGQRIRLGDRVLRRHRAAADPLLRLHPPGRRSVRRDRRRRAVRPRRRCCSPRCGSRIFALPVLLAVPDTALPRSVVARQGRLLQRIPAPRPRHRSAVEARAGTPSSSCSRARSSAMA